MTFVSRHWLMASIFTFVISLGYAQTTEENPLEIIEAASFKNVRKNDSTEMRYLKSSEVKQVILKKDSMWIYCELATQFLHNSNLSASGNILIIDKDSTTLAGDSLFYNAATEKMVVFGDEVVLQNDTVALTTTELFYDTKNGVGSYFKNGRIESPDSNIKSKKGYFFTRQHMAGFRGNVSVENTADSTYIESDTLTYLTKEDKILFHEPTNIQVGKDEIQTEEGYFETETQHFFSEKATVIEGEKTRIECGQFLQTTGSDKQVMRGKVRVVDKVENTILHSDSVFHLGKAKLFKAIGNAFLEKVDGKDTLLLVADTILYDYQKVGKKITAYHNAQFYQDQLFGVCDSLIYSERDSLIHTYIDPIFWSGISEIKADNIDVKLENNKPKEIYIKNNAFIISLDTLTNEYNQLKGRNMVGFFSDYILEKLNIDGNGQMLYFAADSLKKMTGMNKTDCSNMVIYFKGNYLDKFYFLQSPVSQFIPPHELRRKNMYLESFQENFDKKPSFDIFFSRRITRVINGKK